MTIEQPKEDDSYWHYQNKLKWLVERVSYSARKTMFESFISLAQPESQHSVLDVGVTSNRRADSNIFEKFYPDPQMITALGIDDASFLEEEFPGLTFVKGDALDMPFEDKQFDIATSWATIEHVGSRDNQKRFIEEMVRVSKACLITTPNRWYPLEFHTVMPFIHWLPPEQFRKILRILKIEFFSEEKNLNLLSEKDFLSLVPDGIQVKSKHYRLLGPVSNLVFYLE